MTEGIVYGDCLTELPKLDSESVDLLVTDPPYGLSFMGKDWDRAVPSVAIWKECLRVLKAGSFAFIMSSPRLDVLAQMAVRLSEAGFQTGFTPIYWCFASGFPVGEAPQSARSKAAEGRQNALGEPRANHHPTVKPLALMSYLITLGSRSQDVILDPFAGSGTTLIAARILDRKFIGIEIDPEYVKIAEDRLKQYLEQAKLQ